MGHQLLHAEETKGVVTEQLERFGSVSLALMCLEHGDAHFGMAVEGLKVEQVNGSYGLVGGTQLHHQHNLFVGIEVGL